MDLRQQFPRSVRERLGGYVHVARMIDKCRAAAAGTLGEYIYPCPMDKRFLEFVGISADEFLDAVQSRTDEEMRDWIEKTGSAHSEQEKEDWNNLMLSRGPDTSEKWEYFRKIRDQIDPARTDITAWADLLDLEEQRPVPYRTASTASAAST